ncbi:MAG: phage tail tape measure protein [Clostridiales bacterium]|nr:phage tail tape measure protein [Clostridiales bacterium]
MADGKIVIETGLDTSGIEKGIKSTQKSMKSQAASLAAEYRKQGMSASDAFKKAWAEIERSSGNSSQAVKREFRGISQSAEQAANNAEKEWKESSASIGMSLEKIKSLASAALHTIGVAIAGVTTALTGIGGYAAKVGSDFEAGMSKVSAISGATASELDKLTEKAKEMGAKTKFSASEAAAAMEYMAMAGWKTEDMLSGIDGIMNLAAASGEDLALTSDIVTDALTAFGLKADDATHFADVLAVASSSTNTNVAMMGETFKYVAPVAGALGFSAEDCAAAIGLMANSGIKGSQAGTALRSMLSRLAKPTEEVQTAMDQLGVSLTDSKGNMKSLDTIMRDLREGFSGLSEAEKAQMASALAGQEAMSGLLAIVATSDEDFDKLQVAISNADGAAQKMAETMQDNLQGKVTILKSSLEGLGIEVYEEIEEPLKDAAEEGTDCINRLIDTLKKGGLEGAVDEAGDIVAELATKIAQSAPNMVEASTNLLKSFVNGLKKNRRQLKVAANDMVDTLCDGLIQLLPKKMQEPVKKALDSLRRTFDTGTKNLLDMGRGTLEVLGKIFEKLADHMDVVVPSVAALVATFKTFQMVSGPVGSVVSVVLKLKDASKNAGLAVSALNAVMNLNPATLIAGGIALLVGALTTYALTSGRADEAQDAFNKKMDELGASIEKTQNDLDGLKESMENTSSSIDASAAPIEKWRDDLGKCFDSTGKVKEGCEDMASYILNELNTAMGTDYQLTAEGFIENNEGVKQSIDDVNKTIDEYIRTLKQKSLQEATSNQYTEAIQKQGEAQGQLNEAQKAYNTALEDYSKAMEQYLESGDLEGLEKAQKNLDNTREKFGEASKAATDANVQVSGLDAVMSKLAEGTPESVQEALDMYAQIPVQAGDAADGVAFSQEIIKKALSSTDYTKMSEGFQLAVLQIEESGGKIAPSLRDSLVKALNEFEKMGPEGQEQMRASMGQILEAMSEKIPEFKDISVKSSEDVISTFRQYLIDSGAMEGTGKESVDSFVSGVESGKPQANNAAAEVVESSADTTKKKAAEKKPEIKAAGAEMEKGIPEGAATVDTSTVPGQKAQEASDSAVRAVMAGVPLVQQAAQISAGGINTGYQSTDVTSAASATGMDSVQALIEAINSLNASVQKATAGIGSAAMQGLSSMDMPGEFGRQGTEASSQFGSGISKNAQTVSAAASTLGNASAKALKGVNLTSNFQSQAKNAVTGFCAVIRGQTSTAASAVRSLGTSAANALKGLNLGTNFQSQGRSAAIMFITAIKSQTSSAANASTALGTATTQALIRCNIGASAQLQGRMFGTSFKNGITGQTNPVSSAAKALGSSAQNALSGFSSTGHGIGAQFSSGLARGIRAGEHGVVSAAAAVANAAAKAAKRNLEIRSPSGVGRYIGKMFDKGIELDMLKNSKGIEKAANKVTDLMKINPGELLEGMRGAFSSNLNRLTNERAVGNINTITADSSRDAGDVYQEIHFHQEVKTPVQMARAVRREGRRLAFT